MPQVTTGNPPADTRVEVRMGNRVFLPTLATLCVMFLAACSAPGSSAPPTFSAAPTLSASPAATSHPTTPPSPTSPASTAAKPTDGYVGAGVASPAQAAAIVFTSNPLFAEIVPQSLAAVGQSSGYNA